jgi:hypothetical protein
MPISHQYWHVLGFTQVHVHIIGHVLGFTYLKFQVLLDSQLDLDGETNFFSKLK